MIGIDEESALLKNVRAHLLRQTEKILDKESSLSQADVAYLQAVKSGFRLNYAYAA